MKEAIIVGGGTSIKEGLSLGLWDKIKGKEIWSLNYAFEFMPYLPTREIWIDIAFFQRNTDKLENLWKNGVYMVSKKNNRYAQINHDFGEAIHQYDPTKEKAGYHGVHAMKLLTPFIFVGKMGMCGIFALSLAVAEGYNRIWLLGYDWGTPTYGDNNTHFYQEGFKGWSTGVGKIDIYRVAGNPKNVDDFEVYIPTMKEFGIEIYNISPRSNIEAFPKLSYNEFFEKIKT